MPNTPKSELPESVAIPTSAISSSLREDSDQQMAEQPTSHKDPMCLTQEELSQLPTIIGQKLDELGTACKSNGDTPHKSFEATYAPEVSMEDYLKRIMRYCFPKKEEATDANVGVVFICALIYLDRLRSSPKKIEFLDAEGKEKSTSRIDSH